MSARAFTLAAGLWMLGAPALAGTKAQMNIVPTPPDCTSAGFFCLNNGAGCTDPSPPNSDCALSGLKSSSKFKIDGKLVLKGTVTKVLDANGFLVTTGAEGAADNYVFKLSLNQCLVDTGSPPYCDDNTTIYIKVPLKNGNGKMSVDLAPVFAGFATPVAVDDPLMIAGGGLFTPAPAGMCLGTNSSTDIIARLNDPNCDDTGLLGVIGFARDE